MFLLREKVPAKRASIAPRSTFSTAPVIVPSRLRCCSSARPVAAGGWCHRVCKEGELAMAAACERASVQECTLTRHASRGAAAGPPRNRGAAAPTAALLATALCALS